MIAFLCMANIVKFYISLCRFVSDISQTQNHETFFFDNCSQVGYRCAFESVLFAIFVFLMVFLLECLLFVMWLLVACTAGCMVTVSNFKLRGIHTVDTLREQLNYSVMLRMETNSTDVPQLSVTVHFHSSTEIYLSRT